MFDLTAFNVLTIIFIVLSIGLIKTRLSGGKLDNNLPLIFYVFLVLYARGYEGAYNNYVIFAAVIAALLLRFEFLGGIFLKLVVAVEVCSLGYVIVVGFQQIGTR
jgi:hypothetical protein